MNKNLGLVSVIIPTYKGSNKISRAIESVLKQSYQNIEIIIVDDNDSKSLERVKTEDVIRNYKNYTNIYYIKHKKNLNGAAARNTGIRYSKGKYIAFLDDDDFYYPQRIEKSVAYLEENRQFVGVYVGVDVLNTDGDTTLQVRPSSSLKILDLLCNEMAIGTGSNIFVKADILKKIGGFDDTFIRRQDIECMIRICHEGEIGHINDCLIIKSQNGTMNHPSYDKMKTVLNKFNNKFKSDIDKLITNKGKYYAMQYRILLDIALYEHNDSEIREAANFVQKQDRLSMREKILVFIYLNNIRDNFVVDLAIKKFNKVKYLCMNRKKEYN